MNEFERLAELGRLYLLHKEASKAKAVGGVLGAIGRLPGHVARVVDAGAKGAGQAASRAAGGGARGAAVGGLVRVSPYLIGAGALHHAGAGRYMKGKYDQFKARQYATRNYYDPYTQRFI
jgi:hypothetical protein